MFLAALAVLIHFQTPGIIAAVLLRGVIALFTVSASQGDYRSYIFLLGSHLISCSQRF
jgi:hypothetical protein